MQNLLYTLILISFFFNAKAQEKTPEMEVKAVIQTMFDGMRAGDSSMVANAFLRNAPMQTTFYDKNGEMQLRNGTLDGFLKGVGTPHDEIWDEKIWSYDIRVDEPLATAWTEYTFYLGDKQLHCGTNAFYDTAELSKL